MPGAIVTPVSSNSIAEKCALFEQVIRTKIGSPYVIAAMDSLADNLTVVGYEANGGFLQKSSLEKNNTFLAPLPTRDAIIVIICVILLAKEKQLTMSELVKTLPQRFTFSDRLKDFPTDLSKQRLAEMTSGSQKENLQAIKKQFGFVGNPIRMSIIDGLRIWFDNEDIIHFRPSGNAPELRCYTESSSSQQAVNLNKSCLNVLAKWKN